MVRFFLCLAAAAGCCCCLALLVPPVQGRIAGIGLAAAGGGSFGGRGRHPLPGPHAVVTAEELRGAMAKAAKPSWSSSSSWTAAAVAGDRVRPELRSVPGGPDPLHHHGSPWRPELVVPTAP